MNSSRTREVIVVGAGFAGVGAAIKLRQAGVDFLVLEKANEIGGVWRDNTYPDCGCDVPSSFYSYSFAPNPGWTQFFAKQGEIKAYARETAEKYGVMEHLVLDREMLGAAWDHSAKCWRLQTRAGTYSAKFLILACGPMHVPLFPRIKGLASFSGTCFHSSEWRHDVDLRGKKVVVVGTGASAIQFVPKIQPIVQQLTVFQRTPPWVLPKLDWTISKNMRAIFARLPFTQSLLRKMLYLQFELLNLSLRSRWLIKGLQAMGRKNIDRGVKDPELRQRLLPDYAIGCKRILMSNTWYRSLAKANVQLFGGVADIQGSRVIAADGQSCDADAIIFATGFEVADPPIAKRIVGSSGVPLSERWNGSPDAYLGTMTQDCPNLFLTFGPNLYTFSSSFVMLEAQLKFILGAIDAARKQNIASIAVRPTTYAVYNRQLQAALAHTVWNSGCTSYFLDRHGRNSTNWPWTTWYLRRQLERFQADAFTIEHGATPTDLMASAP